MEGLSEHYVGSEVRERKRKKEKEKRGRNREKEKEREREKNHLIKRNTCKRSMGRRIE